MGYAYGTYVSGSELNADDDVFARLWFELGTYLYIAAAGLMLHIVLGVDLRFGLVLEVHFQRLDLFVTAARLVCRIVQRADFRLGVPLQLC